MYKLKKSSSRGYYDTPTRVRSRSPRIKYAPFNNRFKRTKNFMLKGRWWF